LLTIVCALSAVLIPANASAAIDQGYLGNAQPCATSGAGAPLYSSQFKWIWGYYGPELVPADFGAAGVKRLVPGRIALVLPSIEPRFATVIYDDAFLKNPVTYNARRSDLCVANAGVDPAIAALVPAGRQVPDLKLSTHVPYDPDLLELAVLRLTNIPAGVRNAVDSRGGYGVLYGSGGFPKVPGYENWQDFPMMGPYAGDGRNINDVDGTSIGPYLNAGFAAALTRETADDSVALHEYGHLYDYATGKSLQPNFLFGPQIEVQSCVSKLLPNTHSPSYFTGNPLEWYAESFSQYLLSEEANAALKTHCPQTWGFHRYWMGVPDFYDA
jgi:hypothetical protein